MFSTSTIAIVLISSNTTTQQTVMIADIEDRRVQLSRPYREWETFVSGCELGISVKSAISLWQLHVRH